MSQTLASAAARRPSSPTARGPAPARGASRPPRPALRVVQAPVPDHGRTVFVVGCLLLLVGGLLSLLLINTALAQGSFTLNDLQSRSNELGDREQALRQDIAVQGAPGRLAARAGELGMVPSDTVAFLRLPDGKVLGVARPATAPTAPTAPPTLSVPPVRPSAEPVAQQPTSPVTLGATRTR